MMAEILDIAVSLGVGILAGLGVGSGGLLILYLTAVDGMGQRSAQGVNLAVFGFALGAALIVHLHRREIPIPILLFVLGFGTLGALCGSLLATLFSPDGLRTGLGLLLLAMGSFSLFRKTKRKNHGGT